jgi:hypothetical protein
MIYEPTSRMKTAMQLAGLCMLIGFIWWLTIAVPVWGDRSMRAMSLHDAIARLILTPSMWLFVLSALAVHFIERAAVRPSAPGGRWRLKVIGVARALQRKTRRLRLRASSRRPEPAKAADELDYRLQRIRARYSAYRGDVPPPRRYKRLSDY